MLLRYTVEHPISWQKNVGGLFGEPSSIKERSDIFVVIQVTKDFEIRRFLESLVQHFIIISPKYDLALDIVGDHAVITLSMRSTRHSRRDIELFLDIFRSLYPLLRVFHCCQWSRSLQKRIFSKQFFLFIIALLWSLENVEYQTLHILRFDCADLAMMFCYVSARRHKLATAGSLAQNRFQTQPVKASQDWSPSASISSFLVRFRV